MEGPEWKGLKACKGFRGRKDHRTSRTSRRTRDSRASGPPPTGSGGMGIPGPPDLLGLRVSKEFRTGRDRKGPLALRVYKEFKGRKDQKEPLDFRVCQEFKGRKDHRTYWTSRCARDSGPEGPPGLLEIVIVHRTYWTDHRPGQPPACNFLVYATNAGLIDDPTNDTVSVINTGTNIVVDTITVGNAPLEVTVSPNGARAYVTNIFLIPFPLLILLRILLSLPFLLELIQ